MSMDKNIREKLMYLLHFMDYYIEHTIYDVLSDSIEDPQYSAVTTSNLINCYLDVMQGLGEKISLCSLTEYMADKCFTSEEIQLFLEKKAQESTYYVGKQY